MQDDTAEFAPFGLAELVHIRTLETPNAPAVLAGSQSLSFAELAARASNLSQDLLQKGVGPETAVAVYGTRSVEAVIAMLAVLQTGGYYVPLDPSHAPEHLAFILKDAQVRHALVLHDWKESAAQNLPTEVDRIPVLPSDGAAQARIPDRPCSVSADAPAVLLYTSGTTGAPKGVLIPHRAVTAIATGQNDLGIVPDDVVLHVNTIACDGALFDIWAALLNGAALAVVQAIQPSLDEIAETMLTHRASVVLWYAGVHHLMIDHRLDAFASLRLNLAGGDVMSAQHAARLLAAYPDLQVYNSYGPTEATVGALRHRVISGELATSAPVPLGTPYQGYDVFLVDDNGWPIEPGGRAEGQLAIAGPGVALGYVDPAGISTKGFTDDPRDGHSGQVYLTGDLVVQRADGVMAFVGRADRQVKLNGRRVELEGIEHVLRDQPGVRDAVVHVDQSDNAGRAPRICAVLVVDQTTQVNNGRFDAILDGAATVLNRSVLPRTLRWVSELPLTTTGKIDRQAIAAMFEPQIDLRNDDSPDLSQPDPAGSEAAAVREKVAAIWCRILGARSLADDATFFAEGGSSLQLMDAHAAIEAALGIRFDLTLMFETPRLADLTERLAALVAEQGAHNTAASKLPDTQRLELPEPDRHAIAVIGMAARLPGGCDLSDFWRVLREGKRLYGPIAPEEMEDGSGSQTGDNASFVPVRPIVEDADQFDARFFGILGREAELMDPQARVFLELCQHALEDAAIDPANVLGKGAGIGVWAAATPSTYLLDNLLSDRAAVEDFTGTYQLGSYTRITGNSVDSLATRVAHKLDLRGPAMSVGTACSGSLTALAEAVTALRAGLADIALAGGVSITFPQRRGYHAVEGGMAAADGVCRPFDADASGTVFGHGAGVVVLKPLADAIRDGDPVRAVIRGVGLNNDGADKISYTAPSVVGQADAIRKAHRDAGIGAETVGYIECHGTATPLGDPIELTGLGQAFSGAAVAGGRCALGSVKGNVGHLDAAAGVVSLIKCTLMFEAQEIPPVAHFKALNPRIDLQGTPFSVPRAARPWQALANSPRRAGISSFGVGGTNAHVVVEEPPVQVPHAATGASKRPIILPISAHCSEALTKQAHGVAGAISAGGNRITLGAVARTLQDGRKTRAWRNAIVATDAAGASNALREVSPPRAAVEDAPEVVFMFPGQGSQYPGMGRGLYESEPEFALWIDEGAEILAPMIGTDLTDLLCRADLSDAQAARALKDTRLTQPALFLVQFATAQLWRSSGVRPAALIGHSVGEITAAAVAGVMDFETGLRLIARRGQLMQDQPGGCMLSVRCTLEELDPLLEPGMDLAAFNAPGMMVLAGPEEATTRQEAVLKAAGIVSKRLHTSHAFHSAMMDPVVAALEHEIAGMALAAPSLPILSTVTADWMTPEQACDPAFWAGQARATVNFAAAVEAVSEGASRVMLEVGAGTTLSAFAARTLGRGGRGRIFQSLPDHTHAEGDGIVMASAAASLWSAGVPVDLARWGAPTARRISLPGTAFQRRSYWVEPPKRVTDAPVQVAQQPAPPMISAAPLPFEDPTPMTEVVAAPRLDRLNAELTALLSDLSGEVLEPTDADVPFLELGFDSLFMGQVSQALARDYGVEMSFRALLAETPSITALAAHLDGVMPPDAAPPRTTPDAVEPVLQAPQPVAAPAGQHTSDVPPQIPPTPVLSGSAMGGDLASLMQAQLATMHSLMADQLRAMGGGQMPQVSPAAVAEVPTAMVPASAPKTVTAPSIRTDTVATSSSSDARATNEEKSFKFGRGPNLSGAELTEDQLAFARDLARRYSAKFPRSKAFADRHRPALADPRTAAGFRPEWKELTFPVVSDTAKGPYIHDIDGNTFVDLVNGFGQTAFGHSPEFVSRAVAAQMEKGYPIGPQADLAGPVAERFAAVTGHERVTFCNTGSEAVMAAMRLARAVTGREKIVVFTGDYHGQFDEVLVKGRTRGGDPAALPIAPGIPRSGLANMVVLPYGADSALDWIARNMNEIAGVVVEPVQSRHPALRPADFVRAVRRLTAEGGAAMVMDEVVTGFRTHLRGMQAVWGIDADMATYGKVIGGGMPIGVLAGKGRFMDALDGGTWAYGDDSKPETAPTFFAGTFVRHPLVLAAMDAVFDHLEGEGARIYDAVPDRMGQLAQQMEGALTRRGLPADLIEAYSSWFVLNVTQHDPRATLLYPLMRMEGVHLLDGFCGFATTTHGEADYLKVLSAFESALDTLQSQGILEPVQSVSTEQGSPIPAPAPKRAVPLTEHQQEIWMSHQRGSLPAAAFNEGVVISLDGALNQDALQSALDGVIARHDALRMRFARSGESFDVMEPAPLTMTVHDLSGAADPDGALADLQAEEARTPLSLTTDGPARAVLAKLSTDKHALLLTFHHIACDGWSYGVVLEEFSALYSAHILGGDPGLNKPPSFAAIAERTQTPDAQVLSWWADQFAVVPDLPELPTDGQRAAVRSYEGTTTVGHIGPEALKAARKTGGKQGCTLFGTLFAALQMTLGRLSGASDIVLGVPTAGQTLLDRSDTVGHFVNFLPVRVPFDPQEPAATHLQRTGKAVLQAFEHQNITLGTLVRELQIPRDLNRLPLTEIQFNLEKGGQPLPMEGLVAQVENMPKGAVNFDLFFNMVERPDGLRIEVDHNTSLYSPATVRRWIDHFSTLLSALADDPERAIGSLPVVSGVALHDLVRGMNQTDMDYDRETDLAQVIAKQMARTPDALAVEDADGCMTYAALDQTVDAIAAHIQTILPDPGQRVAVCLPRGSGMLAALLAVHRAGHAYVPLDTSQPASRLRTICDTARVAALICQPETAGFADDLELRIIDPASAVAGARPTPITPNPEATAYVIFTSGSTGTPKGVEVPHRAVVNFLHTMAERPGLSANDRFLSVTTVMFDIAVLELFGPLIVGGSVVIASREEILGGFGLVERVGQGDVSVLQATPTLLSMLLEAGFVPSNGLKILAGGEPIAEDLAERLMANGAELWNMYGPTETTVWSAIRRLAPGQAITIGRPIGNTELHILDAQDGVLPVGAVGELNIGGDGLATGYFGRPDLTEQAFRDVLIAGENRRLYRTGDLAQRLPNGEVRVLGRKDTQVKLRGFRIELEEIETRLRAVPGVAAAAVDLRPGADGDPALVGYIVSASGEAPDGGLLSTTLAADLPDYMVPRYWVGLPSLPQTANGKLDRKALPGAAVENRIAADPVAAPVESVKMVPPASESERRIAEIWAQALGLDALDVTASVHALGADSLTVFRMAARMLDAGLDLEARDIFAYPSVRALADYADGRGVDSMRAATPSLRAYRNGARRQA